MSSNVRSFLKFVDAAPSPFHAVENGIRMLTAAGFSQVSEREAWKLQRGGKYFVVRNHSTLIAFVLGPQYSSGAGFNVIAAHTDSPCLKLKPNSAASKLGWEQVGVQCYGGGIWHTWFDRDLRLAGRAVIQNGDKFEERLVHINRPLVRVPTIAIHLNREVNTKLEFNKETHLLPVLATSIKDQLLAGSGGGDGEAAKYPQAGNHSTLMKIMAEDMGCAPEQIRDFEMCLADFQPSALGGAHEEFIFAPRLDNLLSSYAALEALVSTTPAYDESNVLVAALFDNEEVGSQSANGAASNVLEHVMKRITESTSDDSSPQDVFEIAIRKSFLISADMAHARHPNYGEKHQGEHAPMLHNGPVIKNNANQRYATTAVTGFLVRELAQRNGIPIQEFVVRNDSACGSTVGPMLSARGLRTMDIGAPQLSMHSIREMMGTDDVDHSINLFKAFYGQFTALDASVNIDC
eukprot:TRINITY_DN1527_c1_g2_i1.p1 TRINITY_DN1527_c1_g2~~TRINITY_DN1527_c1_g2_i1.p1  ORF type:complete len:478 (-),score=165.51 TRINITY_DN1527_c1_g2_i1:421-1809(-)